MKTITIKITFSDEELEGYEDCADEIIVEDFLGVPLLSLNYEILQGEEAK